MSSSQSGSKKRIKSGRESDVSSKIRKSEEINARLAMPRSSLSPSRFTREAFLDFKEKNQEALTDDAVMSTAFLIITGTANILKT